MNRINRIKGAILVALGVLSGGASALAADTAIQTELTTLVTDAKAMAQAIGIAALGIFALFALFMIGKRALKAGR